MPPVFAVLLAVIPVFMLLGAQIYLTLHKKALIWKLIPFGISIGGSLCLFLILPESAPGVYRILITLYLILLLILCGIGWVIAASIQKSGRRTSQEQEKDG